MNKRDLRAEETIKHELGQIIVRELEFDSALPTITAVESDRRMNVARIGISVWPSDKSDYALKVLRKSSHRLGYILMKRMRIRSSPKLIFFVDHGPENAANIEKMLMQK